MVESMNIFIEDQNIKSQVKAIQDDRGVVIKIDMKVIYKGGEADIIPASIPMLDSVVKLLHSFEYSVRVEGHTDDIPIRSDKFPSNWELSSSRAASVVRHFISKGIPAKRFVVEGYSSFHPMASNDTKEGRAENRRVEIVFRKEEIQKKISSEVNLEFEALQQEGLSIN
jgi:chemotaxis protein MotB